MSVPSASSFASSSSHPSSSSSPKRHHPSNSAAQRIRPRRSASYQHHPKSRSTGSLSPLPRSLAMVSSSAPIPAPAPSHTTRPGIPTSKSMTIHPRHVSQQRSAPPRASYKVTSPSRLPQTDTLSYFPPFETMGSTVPDAGAEKSDGESPDEVSALLSRPDGRGRPTHTKGRSLGSIPGFLNSFGIFTRKAAPLDSTASPSLARTTSDGDAVQALTKRVTPGKRKVLETISVANQDIKMATRRVSDGQQDAEVESKGKANSPTKAPSAEAAQSKKPSLHLPIPQPSWSVPIPSPPVASISPLIPSELFSFFVDNPATTVSPAAMSTSPSKKTLALSTSPPASDMDVPGLAHSSRRSSSSSTRSLRSFTTVSPTERESISPVSSFSTLLDSSTDAEGGASEPCTPEKSWVQGMIIPPTLAFSDSIKTFSAQLDGAVRPGMESSEETDDETPERGEEGYLGARLRRGRGRRARANSAASARSADSNRTIRPGTYAKEEITPKVGRGWRAMSDDEDGVEYFRPARGSPRWSIGAEVGEEEEGAEAKE